MKLLGKLSVALILSLLVLPPQANSKTILQLNNNELNLLNLAQDYLDKIKTFKANFIQFNPRADIANGTFYLSRPGQLKMSYSSPFRMDYYISNDDLIQYDWDLDQVSRGSAPENPLKVLLYQGVSLKNNDLMEVTQVLDTGKTFNIYLATKSDEITEITGMILKFQKLPVELVGIQRLNNEGEKTDVTFSTIEMNKKIDEEVFEFSRPKAKYPGRR